MMSIMSDLPYTSVGDVGLIAPPASHAVSPEQRLHGIPPTVVDQRVSPATPAGYDWRGARRSTVAKVNL
jgi:hypothetical protein